MSELLPILTGEELLECYGYRSRRENNYQGHTRESNKDEDYSHSSSNDWNSLMDQY